MTNEEWDRRTEVVAAALDQTNPKDLAGQKKTPLRLVSPIALAHIAFAMRHGAEKYGPYNWREKQIGYSLYIEAAKRHLDLLADGEDIDDESGHHHAAHVAACALIILDALECESLIDDRHKTGKLLGVYKRLQQAALDRHPHPTVGGPSELPWRRPENG